MLVEDADTASAGNEDTKVFERPLAYIPNDMFDAARGKPATIRPPPSVSVSVAELELDAKGREELAERISLAVGRRESPLVFTADVSIETVKNIAAVIVNRSWLPDATAMRDVILCLTQAYDPKRISDQNGKDDETLYDDFLAMLVEEVKRPKLAETLSQKRAKAQGSQRKRL